MCSFDNNWVLHLATSSLLEDLVCFFGRGGGGLAVCSWGVPVLVIGSCVWGLSETSFVWGLEMYRAFWEAGALKDKAILGTGLDKSLEERGTFREGKSTDNFCDHLAEASSKYCLPVWKTCYYMFTVILYSILFTHVGSVGFVKNLFIRSQWLPMMGYEEGVPTWSCCLASHWIVHWAIKIHVDSQFTLLFH